METPNHEYIEQLSGGDKAFADSLIDILSTELAEDIDSYKAAMSKKDYLDAKLYVHRIKHKMGMLGLESSYKRANDFENGLLESNLGEQSYFESMLPIMTEFLASN